MCLSIFLKLLFCHFEFFFKQKFIDIFYNYQALDHIDLHPQFPTTMNVMNLILRNVLELTMFMMVS